MKNLEYSDGNYKIMVSGNTLSILDRRYTDSYMSTAASLILFCVVAGVIVHSFSKGNISIFSLIYFPLLIGSVIIAGIHSLFVVEKEFKLDIPTETINWINPLGKPKRTLMFSDIKSIIVETETGIQNSGEVQTLKNLIIVNKYDDRFTLLVLIPELIIDTIASDLSEVFDITIIDEEKII